MKDLVVVKNDVVQGKCVQTVDARELHEFLEVKTPFKDWVKRRIEEYDFVEGVDYTKEKVNDSEQLKNEQAKSLRKFTQRIEYTLTIDMAKELSMVEKNDRGKQARKYFIDCENRYKEKLRRDREKAENSLKEYNSMSPAEQLLLHAQKWIEHEKKMKEVEGRLLLLEAKTERNSSMTGFFSIRGFCKLNSIRIPLRESQMLGKQCSTMCIRMGINTGKVYDEVFGEVNTYPEEVLLDVFKEFNYL